MSVRRSALAPVLLAALLLAPSNAESALSMQLTDQITGGDVQSVAASGSYAYVAARDVAYVVDLSDPASPEVVAQLEPIGQARSVVLDGSILYLGADGSGVEIYDVSDPIHPNRISQVPISGWQTKMHLQGDRLFVAAGSGGLVMVDVSDPYNPWARGQYALPDLVITDVFVDGNTAYCAAGIFELDIYIGYLYTFDVSSWQPLPTTPPQEPPYYYDLPRRVYVADGIVYLAAEGDTYRQLLSPKVALPTWDFLATSFHPLGSDLVMTDFSGVRVYRGENEIASLELEWGANDGFLAGNTLYRAVGLRGFQWIDVTDPELPTLAGSFGLPAGLRELVARPGAVYTGSFRDHLFVLDTRGSKTTVATTVAGGVIDLLLAPNDLLYRSTGETIEVLDLADPWAPVVVSTFAVDWAYRMVQSGRRLYVLDSRSQSLRVLDASQPRSGLSSLGETPLTTRPTHLAAYGDVVYVADQWNDLTIFDATDPAVIELVSTEDLYSIRGLEVAGDRLYRATGGLGVEILDLGDPRAPDPLGSTPGNIWSFEVSGNLLTQYDVTADVMQVYDVSDPSSPSLRASQDFTPTVMALHRVGHEIHAAGNNVGYFRFAIDAGVVSTPPARAESMVLGSRPNPARGRTEIFFTAPADGAVELELFDLAGRRVRDWRRQARAGETVTLVWDGRDARARSVSQGVYVLRARSAGKEAFHRIAWIR